MSPHDFEFKFKSKKDPYSIQTEDCKYKMCQLIILMGYLLLKYLKCLMNFFIISNRIEKVYSLANQTYRVQKES